MTKKGLLTVSDPFLGVSNPFGESATFCFKGVSDPFFCTILFFEIRDVSMTNISFLRPLVIFF